MRHQIAVRTREKVRGARTKEAKMKIIRFALAGMVGAAVAGPVVLAALAGPAVANAAFPALTVAAEPAHNAAPLLSVPLATGLMLARGDSFGQRI